MAPGASETQDWEGLGRTENRSTVNATVSMMFCKCTDELLVSRKGSHNKMGNSLIASCEEVYQQLATAAINSRIIGSTLMP